MALDELVTGQNVTRWDSHWLRWHWLSWSLVEVSGHHLIHLSIFTDKYDSEKGNFSLDIHYVSGCITMLF